jgi:hypothetical protein
MTNLKFKSWMDSNRGAYWGGVVWWGKGRGNWMMPQGHSRWGWGHAHSTSLKYHLCSLLWLKLSSWKISSNSTENSKMAENSVGTAYKLIKKSAENPFQECLLLSKFCSVINEFYWESTENLLRIRNLSFFFSTFAEQLFATRKQQLVYTLDFFSCSFLFLPVRLSARGFRGLACSSVCCYSFNKSLKL